MKIPSASGFSKAARVRLGLVVSCLVVLGNSVGLGVDTTTHLPPRALAQGKLPNDRRLEPLKDLDGYFPFTPPATPEEWDSRARQVRRELAVALGLWPMPDKTPLNAVIHGKIEQIDYTIEKVYFESLPGFFVTGNLYRPKGRTDRLPAVLCPHGHWRNGRFMDSGPEDVRKQIDRGEEKFEDGGRSVLQARCVQLARMGCVVFHYDMIGYADSTQIPENLAHGFARQRPEMNSTENWGLFSPQAEAHLQSVMGLQTWNSIRALDFLVSLPDVDAKRIGVTGASGGGTQTFILGALDERPAVTFPAVMVGTAMQGGCTCENACLLRVDTGNVEIAALFAPKPLGLTAADDWTKEMPTKGFPELQKHFAMLGAPQNVVLTPLLQFEHNYNYPSRAAMYGWMNTHLRLGLPEPIVEEDYQRLSARELTVWDNDRPKPTGGPEFERKLLRWITDRDQKLLANWQTSYERFRDVYGGAWDAIIGRNLGTAGTVTLAGQRTVDRGDHIEEAALLRNETYGEEIPVLFLKPKRPGTHAVIWADSMGKQGLYASDAEGKYRLKPTVQKLLNGNVTVISADLLYQGEFLPEDQPVRHSRKVKNPREAAAYTFGYNRTLFAQRVHDLLSVVQAARSQQPNLKRLDLVGWNGAGAWIAAAKAQAGDAVKCVALDTGGFRFINVPDIYDVNFLPGSAKYGDLPGLLALGAPDKLWLAGEGTEAPDLLKRLYQAAGVPQNVTVAGPSQSREEDAIKWLLKQKD
ncbi:MAG TPA: acetylxylan esterase [Verrucomicrobiae bacterium]|nr:acetylxylan esterase [Verrucomicrobiae bacterium]